MAASKNLGWLWFFAVLIVLTISATVILIAYNLGQQLRLEQLATAQENWREKGPASYRMIYKIKINVDAGEPRTDHYEVTVQVGKVTRAMKNGQPESPGSLPKYGMDRLLGFVAENIATDQEKGRPRTFTRAIFDPKTGALFWYVRRVMGSSQRVEITMEKLEAGTID